MPISFLDLTRQNPQLEAETSAALVRVIEAARLSLGRKSRRLRRSGPAFVRFAQRRPRSPAQMLCRLR